MSLLPVMSRRKVLFLSFVIILAAVYFSNKIHNLYSIVEKLQKHTAKKLFTEEDLAEYNGIKREPLYLAILGSIYDVTPGRKHYEKGAPYHYFVGKDGSRSFITGKFSEDYKEQDQVLDLNCEELMQLKNWRDNLKSRYEYKGRLIGRYYNGNGEATPYMKELRNKLNQCIIEKELTKTQQKQFPPCNIEWTSTEGSRVWCTKDSGGISRNWIGVPRQLYVPGEVQPHCACINVEQDLSGILFKEYEGCHPSSVSCVISNSN